MAIALPFPYSKQVRMSQLWKPNSQAGKLRPREKSWLGGTTDITQTLRADRGFIQLVF